MVQSDTKLSPGLDAPSKARSRISQRLFYTFNVIASSSSQNFSTSDDFVLLRVSLLAHQTRLISRMLFLQALAARIDEWDTHGLFKAEGSKGLLWLILGLSQDPRYTSGAEKMYELASGTSFNRIATVFWVHMVFDMLAYQGELQFGAPRTVVPNPNQLEFLRKKEGVKSVCSSRSLRISPSVLDLTYTASYSYG